MARFSSWYQNVSEDERTEQEQRGLDYAEQQLREQDAAGQAPAPARRPRARTDGDGDWEPPSILRKRR